LTFFLLKGGFAEFCKKNCVSNATLLEKRGWILERDIQDIGRVTSLGGFLFHKENQFCAPTLPLFV